MSRDFARLKDLKADDKIEVDGGFTCMLGGIKTIEVSVDGELFVRCNHGHHYLDGQQNWRGELVGMYKLGN